MSNANIHLLAMLKRKQDIELECARADLARLRAQESTQQQSVRNLRALLREHASGAAVRVGGRIDAGTYTLALEHLVDLRATVVRNEGAASALRERMQEAVARWVAQERKRSSIHQLCEAGEGRLRAAAQWRAAKDSDHAWLARCASGSEGAME